MKFWKTEFTGEEIEFVFAKLKEMRTLTPEGEVSFTGGFGSLDSWVSFLVSASKFEVRTDTLRTKIIKKVLFSPNLVTNFSERDFRKIAYQLRHKFQNVEIKHYKVVFPIWNKPDFLIGQKKIGDVTVNFTPSKKTKLFKKIISERSLQQTKQDYEALFTQSNRADLEKCSICITHVKANDPFDAYERASEAVYEILGLVNLVRDRGKYRRRSFRTRGKLPVSEVLIGPHTTTHFANGALTHDGFWYEKWVGGPNCKKVKGWEKRYNQLSKGVAKSPWRDQCKSALARYYKAFSNPNLEESFLDGWRLFENITGDRSQAIAEKIDRASNVFGDSIEPRIIGKHLAHRRNLISHGHAINADDDELLAFQMLQFIVHYMELFILNGFKFCTLKEFWEFLDLPNSKGERDAEQNALKRRLLLLDKAAHFRRDEG